MEESRFSKQIYVLVSTDGDTFRVSPDPVIVQNRRQEVIWIAEDPDVEIEITFQPSKGGTKGVEPPGKPCTTPARRCGEGKPIGGNVGEFYYEVTGSKAGKPLLKLDPVLEILY